VDELSDKTSEANSRIEYGTVQIGYSTDLGLELDSNWVKRNHSYPTMHVQFSLGITLSALPASEIGGRRGKAASQRKTAPN